MTDLVSATQVVQNHYTSIDAGKGLRHFTTPDYCWHGVHPFHTLHGAATVEAQVWRPLRASFGPLQRRVDVQFAAPHPAQPGNFWVVQMGHLLGLHDQPWLGIRPTRKIALLRYAEVHRVQGDVICETISFFDILSVIRQAGLNPLPRQTGAQIDVPGPLTHDGLVAAAQDPRDSQKTHAMLEGLCDLRAIHGLNLPMSALETLFAPDLSWFGPAGIGTILGLPGLMRQHITPFARGLDHVQHHGPKLVLAQGNYGLTHSPAQFDARLHGLLGLTQSPVAAEMRTLELYRRDAQHLAEAWVFMDLLHFLNKQGYDLLDRLPTVSGP